MALVERLQLTTDATHWKGAIPLNFIYTPGRAGERFLRTLMKDGRLTAGRCDSCGVTYLPPRTFCERCFERIEDKLVELSGRGVVHTFCLSHESYDGKPHEPTVVAMIRLDGADGLLMHRIGEVDPASVRIGMSVEPVLAPRKNRQGSILDILHFKPSR